MNERPPPWSAVTDIGRLGLETAAVVVERLLAASRATLNRQPSGFSLYLLPATADGSDARRMRADAERLIDLYADWARTLVDAAAQTAHPNGGPDDRLVIGPIAPTESTRVTIWLHSLDGPATGPARLRTTDLIAHHGGSVPSDSIRFDPPVIEGTGPRTSHEIAVVATVPARVDPGPYHGYVLADGIPEVSLPVCLEVVAP